MYNFNHQTTNLVFPYFFHKFFSDWAVEKENKLFIGSKQGFFLSFGTMKSLFSFYWEKFVEKFGDNKIGGLMVWCHEHGRNYFHLIIYLQMESNHELPKFFWRTLFINPTSIESQNFTLTRVKTSWCCWSFVRSSRFYSFHLFLKKQ